MTSESEQLRIIVIDDNSGIHQDYNKILTIDHAADRFEQLDKLILGSEPTATETLLPSFRIDNAYQGQEGVQLIEQALKEGAPYSLAFVDIQMPPGWDGIETIKHIWALDQDIQIVICTAYSDYTWEETVANLGISDNLLILKKPFEAIAVRQLACALTKKWQLMQIAKIHTKFLEQAVIDQKIKKKKQLLFSITMIVVLVFLVIELFIAVYYLTNSSDFCKLGNQASGGGSVESSPARNFGQ